MAKKSGFTEQEVRQELELRAQAERDIEAARQRPVPVRGGLECIHCGRPYPRHEGGGGLCDYCLHRD